MISKEMSSRYWAVLEWKAEIIGLGKQCCGSGMFIPDPNFFHPGSTSKNLGILPKKICFSSPNMIQIVIADPDTEFFAHPGSRVQKYTRSRTLEEREEKVDKLHYNDVLAVNSRNQGFSYYFCLMIEGFGFSPLTNGSGSRSRRPKNIFRRIRIRNTADD